MWAYSAVYTNAPKHKYACKAVYKQITDGLIHNVHYKNKKTPRKRAFDLLLFAFVFFSVAIGLYLFFHGGNDKNVLVQFRNTSLYVIGNFP